jgi:cholesterol oxidase
MNETHFDAVIVGSGFGGSVMTYRLAEAGLRVCLLERGKAYPPGSFPRSPFKMKRNFWDPSEGLYGIFNIWSFDNLGAVVSSGLGGGSLIYANVLIRKPKEWFVEEDPTSGERREWPVQREELDDHYECVERMLGAQQYPFTRKPYSDTPKTKEFIAAAEKAKLEWDLPKLAVTFADVGKEPGEPIREVQSVHGRTPRYTCRLVGECDLGCNYGSKNTLDLTYLSEAAKRPNVDIKCLCEVRSFEPRNGGADDSEGYTVRYVKHDLRYEEKRIDTDDPNTLPPQTITTKRLILCAGTLGSTFLLLKMRAKNPRAFSRISTQLGQRFGGNGDFLMLATKAKVGASGKKKPRILDPSYGPVITSTVRVPASEDGGEGRGHYVQDAGYPEFVNWNLRTINTPLKAARILRFLKKWLDRDSETDMGAEAARLFGKTESSLLPMLGMGRDVPDGKMELRDGKLNIDWHSKASRPYFLGVRETMRDLAGRLEARLWSTPLWWLSRFITVHPLGGCPMGLDDTEGVVDSYGKVFNYDRLYVADGSVMPGPVGPNPSLTIAALADRFADRVIEEHRQENT